jgi:hypothetical protein
VVVRGSTLNERARTLDGNYLGADHPDSLAARANLASWTGRTGSAADAVAQYSQLLDDLVRVLGADHARTLAVRDGLAHWITVWADA